MKKIKLIFLLVTVLAGLQLKAGIWLPAIFGDHMVLQAEKPIKVWGKADAGEEIKVELLAEDGTVLAKSKKVKAEEDRKWSVTLPAVAAGKTLSMKITGSKSGEKILKDILTGEVWVCSGQSNMRWTVAKSKDAEKEITAADYPGIRLFQTERITASKPLGNLKGQWEVCSPETVGKFSGAGYYFGRDLHKSLKCPVGLIHSSWGGSPIHAWTPQDVMDANPATAHISKKHKAYFAKPPKARRKARGTWIYGGKGEYAPARLYNAMIAPLMPFTIRGVTWCQGEHNSRLKGGRWDGPDVYAIHFPMMIKSWRDNWGQGDFPFMYVELANIRELQKSPVDAEAERNWGYIREAQSSALSLPNVYGISTVDIGDPDDVHYKNKQEVGRRLALAACGNVYKTAAAPTLCPRYVSHAVEGDKIRIKLANAEGLKTDDGKTPHAFAIQEKDGEWKWAETKIDGEDIIVWHSEIKKPTAVRHAWACNPDVNVYNKAQLPLTTFSTDKPILKSQKAIGANE